MVSIDLLNRIYIYFLSYLSRRVYSSADLATLGMLERNPPGTRAGFKLKKSLVTGKKPTSS
jgi:hypothetical protein